MSGINPFSFAPDAIELASLRRDYIDTLINHPHLNTVYPPFCQLMFGLAYLISPGSITGFHVISLFFEIVSLFIIKDIADKKQTSNAPVLFFLLPTTWAQIYLPGHTEVLALPFVCGLIWLRAIKPILWLESLCLACLVLIKPVAIILVPLLYINQNNIIYSIKTSIVSVVIVVAAYLPFLDAGPKLFSSTQHMLNYWSYNGSLSNILSLFLKPNQVRPALAGFLLLGTLILSFDKKSFNQRAQSIWMLFFLCTPVMHPWYALWSLAHFALKPTRTLALFLTLLAISDITYVRWRIEGVWTLELWQSLIVYISVFLSISIAIWRRYLLRTT